MVAFVSYYLFSSTGPREKTIYFRSTLFASMPIMNSLSIILQATQFVESFCDRSQEEKSEQSLASHLGPE
jgi:hypothetical protein